jgi:disulfide oxidoreductase YuzD
MLLMVTPVRVTIVGAPVACGADVKDTWRELSEWVGDELRRRYGDAVVVGYHDLFDADRPSLPIDAQLPLVMVDDHVVTSGGKLSIPAIRKALEGVGVAPVSTRSIGAASGTPAKRARP